jgi:serine/threonine-protein kinase
LKRVRCPDENVLAEYVDNVLDSKQRRTVEQHLDTCTACRTVVSDLARMQHAAGDEQTVADAALVSVTGHTTLHAIRQRRRTSHIVPGTMIGEYEVKGVLGAGGMGIVFAAVHPRIGKKAAIKILKRDETLEASAIVRFENEAKAVNEIGHPNIVDIFGFGELPNGDPYYVMEHVEGQSLHAWIYSHGPVSLDRALPILRQICDALTAAHERGIIHRDLKPGNIMVAGSADAPRVKVLDFGLAKMARTDNYGDELTVPGVAIGTPAFMSPEQFMAREVDQRTDVYALGVLVYQMLCGAYPFQGETPSAIGNQHLYHTPAKPSHLANLPERVDHVVSKALAKKVEERYATIREFRADLETCLAEPPRRPSTGPISPTAMPDESTLQPGVAPVRALSTAPETPTKVSGPPAMAIASPTPAVAPIASLPASTQARSRSSRWIIAGLASAIVAFAIVWIIAGRPDSPSPAAHAQPQAPTPPMATDPDEKPAPVAENPTTGAENPTPIAEHSTPADSKPATTDTSPTPVGATAATTTDAKPTAVADTKPTALAGTKTTTTRPTRKTTKQTRTTKTTPITTKVTPTGKGSANIDDDRMLLEGGTVKKSK